jgi:hypothetical protein
LKQEQQEEEEEDPMANFIYALKAAGTKRQWPRRLKIFFDFFGFVVRCFRRASQRICQEHKK